MTSPLKIILLALCVSAVVAYFGEGFLNITEKLQHNEVNQERKSDHELVYADTNMAEYHGVVRVPIARDGHYWVTLDVNGVPVKFVVDTGASHVSLSYQDAVAVGLDPEGLMFNRQFRTANGNSQKAIVTLRRMTLDTIQISDIQASVSQRGRMDVSLLGMNFLNKLSGFHMEEGELILKP